MSGVKVVWGGMDLVVKYNSDFTSFKRKLSIPLFELTAPTKGSAHLSNLVFQSDSSMSPNKIRTGSTNLTVDEIKVKWDDKIDLGFKLGDMLHTLTGISSTEFLNGIDAIDPNSFAFSNVSYVANSHDLNNLFGADADVHFDSLITHGRTYGPLDLSLSVDHISSPEFSKLMDKIEDVTTSPASTSKNDNQAKMREELIKTLKQYFGPILVNKPIIRLNKFNLKTPDGLVQISGNATTESFVLSDMNDQKKFMQKLAVDINLSVPKPVLSYLFVLQMRYLLSAGNAQMDQQSSDALTKVVNILLDNQVNIWMKKGYITNESGVLATHLSIKSGKLFLNNKASE